jgi:P4 family phage/plasmid primase-like protien
MEAFLKKFTLPKDKDEDMKRMHNYTRLPGPEYGVFPASYAIPQADISEFYEKYKTHVYKNNSEAYLTEKQLEEGPILIDIDFRYPPEIDERQHTKKHVSDFVELLLECINKIKNNNGKEIMCYVYEKDNVNTSDEKITKDGIHIMINLKTDSTSKTILRNMILAHVGDIWEDLSHINTTTWDDVFDKAILGGTNSWPLLGSRKPGNEDYKIKYMFSCIYTDNWTIKENKITPEWVLTHFENLTARSCTTVVMNMNELIKEEYDKINRDGKNKRVPKNLVKMLSSSYIKSPLDIKNQEDLDNYIDENITQLDNSDFEIKEAHNYVMILPIEFWGPNSFNKWIRVGWALKNTDNRLFISWIKFSSQSQDFNYADIGDLFEKWNGFESINKDCLTLRSIMYWCKTTNETEYKAIHNNTIQYYMYYSINNNSTDYDLANVVFQLYKESYICVNYKNNVWYEFVNNRWTVNDSGISLKSKLSTDVFSLYSTETRKRLSQKINEPVHNADNANAKKDDAKDIIEKLSETAKKFKKDCVKNIIMNECKEIFYDNNFYDKLDTNPYLLGCNNCIIDFKNKTHRKGKHDDYISKSTGIDYYPLSHYKKSSQSVIDEITLFMKQLFPEEELRNYMWQHLASTLLGTNENQTFNLYIGSGANGKSIMVNLMSKTLGNYKGTVPITLITQKRNAIGSTSSEIYNLIGTRYAVMQEPSKNDKINEGIMKELTGGDPIQCRALFKDSITFIPQFKMAVSTNNLPKLDAMDDGTWRRVRVVEFKSKFTKDPYNDVQFPKEDYPFQYPIDTKIDEKFSIWAPIFLSMLVDIAYEYQGKVHDCESVLASSNKYRQDQNVYLEYISERIVEKPSISGSYLKIGCISDDFKKWYSTNYGTTEKIPTIRELKEYICKKYGKCSSNGWSKISLVDIDE